MAGPREDRGCMRCWEARSRTERRGSYRRCDDGWCGKRSLRRLCAGCIPAGGGNAAKSAESVQSGCYSPNFIEQTAHCYHKPRAACERIEWTIVLCKRWCAALTFSRSTGLLSQHWHYHRPQVCSQQIACARTSSRTICHRIFLTGLFAQFEIRPPSTPCIRHPPGDRPCLAHAHAPGCASSWRAGS